MSQLFNTGVIVSKGNSTNIPLLAHASFVGTTDDVTSYEEIDINVAGNPYNAPGSLYFEFSPDGINWDVSVLVGGVEYYGPNIAPQHLRVVLPYFRIRYVNGSINQSTFRLTVLYHRSNGTRLTRYLNQQIDNTEGVENVRAFLSGHRPDGYYGNLAVNSSNVLLIDGTTAITDGYGNIVGISNVGGEYALKVDVIQTVGGAGSGGTSSSFNTTFPPAGTAVGFTDGSGMRGATVFDLDTSAGTQFVLGTSLRLSANGGSVDFGTPTHPIRIDPTGTTTQPVSGTITANAGTGNFTVIGNATDNTPNVTDKLPVLVALSGSSPPTWSDGNIVPLSVDDAGNLRITGSISASNPSVSLINTLAPGSATFIGGLTSTSAPVNVNGQLNALSLTIGGALRIDGSAVIQPISGTVTANAGSGTFTVGGTVTANQGTANTLANAWPVEITDGTNVLGTLSHPVRTDPTGTTTQPVSGTVAVTQSTSPWATNVSQFGDNNVVTGTGASGTGIPRVTVANDSNILTTQSGTWTVAQGAPNTLANKWPVQITDGTNVMPTGDVAARAGFDKITDGTNTAAVKAASTPTTVADPALVVALSPNSPLPAGTNLIGSVIVSDTVTTPLSVAIADSGTNDAFSRLRISAPITLFDSQQQYGDDPAVWETSTTGAGATTTNLLNESTVQMTTGATTNGNQVIRQTKTYHRYQPGKSQLVVMTFCFDGGAVTNVTRRVGYFDANNGIYLEQVGSTVNITRRTFVSGSAINTVVAQASWNLDKFDGTGPSGITLDLSKTQILVIDLQWLGVGRVRVGFDINGIIYYAHYFNNANVMTTVYMTTGNLPIRYEITNTGVAGSIATMRHICAVVTSEGGVEYGRAKQYSASTGGAGRAIANNGTIPLMSIRAKTTGPNAVRNTGQILPKSYEITVLGNNEIFWQLVLNPASLTGASFTAFSSTTSITEVDTSATDFTGGTVIDSGFLNSSVSYKGITEADVIKDLVLVYSGLLNSQDILTVVASAEGGATTGFASLTWLELW